MQVEKRPVIGGNSVGFIQFDGGRPDLPEWRSDRARHGRKRRAETVDVEIQPRLLIDPEEPVDANFDPIDLTTSEAGSPTRRK